MLESFEVYGQDTDMDFGYFRVNEKTAKEVGTFLLKLTNTPEEMKEVEVSKPCKSCGCNKNE